MDMLINNIKQKVKDNKDTILFCLTVTFVIGLITHAYMYFQDSFSHDSLKEFNGNEYNVWKIQLGRILVPLYRLLTRGNLTLPWLIGLFALLWIGLSVFLTVKLFDVKSKKLMALISGIYTCNVTVIALTGTYINDLDSNMFALFIAVLTVYLWQKYKYGYLLAIPLVIISLGIYQSFISVTVTLIVMVSILKLLQGDTFKSVFCGGLKIIPSFLVGGGCYFALFKAVLIFGKIEEVEGYNSLSKMFSMGPMRLIQNIIDTYYYTVYNLLFPQTTMSLYVISRITIVLIGITGAVVMLKLLSKKIKVMEKILALILLGILPVAMNVAKIMSNGMSHDLMIFSIWLTYLFVLLVVCNADNFEIFKKESGWNLTIAKASKLICVAIILLTLMSNVVMANEIYLKKDLEQDAALAYFTRVLDEMDDTYGYDREETKVVFIGKPEIFTHSLAGFEDVSTITGDYNYVMGFAEQSFYESYFKYKLHYSIIVGEADVSEYLANETIKDMPAFPEEGSLQMLDGELIVKLGEIE